jgi:hypothetical protein
VRVKKEKPRHMSIRDEIELKARVLRFSFFFVFENLNPKLKTETLKL